MSSAAQHMFPIRVRHPATGEIVKFLGQGATLAEACSDGVKNLLAPYRPSSDGKIQPKLGIGVPPKASVMLADGRTVNRKLSDWESGVAYDETKEVVP